MPVKQVLAVVLAVLFGSACTENRPPKPDQAVKETPPTDPFERELVAKGYGKLMARKEPPDSLLGPLIADLATIRGTAGSVDQQIGSIRTHEIEFGGRTFPIRGIYGAIRSGRIFTIFQTAEMTFYFSNISDLKGSEESRFFLVTESFQSGERAEFVIK